MRISLVISSYDAHGGGAERWTHHHAQMLLARGHEVHLVARRFRDAPEGAIRQVVSPAKAGRRARMSFGEDAEVLLRTLGSDVVHDMGDGWYADVFMPHHGTRRGSFKYNTHHLAPLVQRARRFAKRWVPRYREFRALERRQYDFSSDKLYVAVSKMIRDHMCEFCHVPEDLVRVVYNGVDTSRFRPSANEAARATFRAMLGIDPGETVFLTVAHNFRLKGVDALVRAVASLRQASEPARLVVVGDGDVHQYESMARSLGCADSIDFVGDQRDALSFYQAADVFALPTMYDPCSLVVLEAMAVGLPIITSRRNGVHELMREGVEGVILDSPSDAEELTEAMRRYLDADRRSAAGRAARVLAETHSSEHTLEEHVAVYEEILARRRSAARATATPRGEGSLRSA